jgi:hypothetical protein
LGIPSPNSRGAANIPHEDASQMALIGEPARSRNLVEWYRTLVDEALREGNSPVQNPAVRRNT